ncbi:MAG TPA: hypothetical protein VGR72_07620 [Candidatus Acidoferrales bacterium]|nr:hypothetical protein [Candidatus Acidoferrales bacterium]
MKYFYGKSETMRALLASFAAASLATAPALAQQTQSQDAPRKFKVIYVVPKPATAGPANMAAIRNQVMTGSTIPLWNFSQVAYDSNTYAGQMVGRSPFARGRRTTTVATFVVPVKITMGDTSEVFDPSVADLCAPGGKSVDTLVVASPIFQNSSFSMNGASIGSTQYLDAFQRANFWSKVSGTPYHTIFSTSPTVLAAVSVSVPKADGSTMSKSLFGGCRDLATVDINWWDNQVQTVILPNLASKGVGPQNFPQFVLDSVGFTVSGHCCALGYHNAFFNASSLLQTYSVNMYDTSGGFGGDISVMSHEVAEWMDDPGGGNPTPAWGAEGQVTAGSCQNNLEDGDPLTPGFGTPSNSFSVTLGGATYTLQELAFFSWFMGSPSLGAGGLFSDHGTFTGHAKACPPGGTN